MDTKSVGRYSRVHKSWLAISLALVCVVSAGSANALVLVEDLPHTIQNIITQLGTQAKHVAEYSAQAQRWAQQYQHMQQQLIKLQAFMSISQTPMTDNFQERAEDYGMAEACPSADGGSPLADFGRWLAPDMEGDIVPQQQTICRYIVTAENRKYNETVKLLRSLRQHAQQWQQIEKQRMTQVGASEGALAANENNVNRFTTQLQQDLDYWQAMMTAYDSYIGLLNVEQQRLAERAMRGKHDILGTVVQGAVLKGALEAARSRDR